MNQSGGARLNLLMFWFVVGGILVGANGIYGLVHYTQDSRPLCLGCHEKSPGTKGLWDLSPMHAEGVACPQCHSVPGGYLTKRFSAKLDTVNPNCMGCHWPVLEGKISPRRVYVREAGAGLAEGSQEILYHWDLKDLMYTWHIEKRICVCTDCHRNISHDKGGVGVRYVPQMAYCAECHYHASKDDYATMRPLPALIAEEKASTRR